MFSRILSSRADRNRADRTVCRRPSASAISMPLRSITRSASCSTASRAFSAASTASPRASHAAWSMKISEPAIRRTSTAPARARRAARGARQRRRDPLPGLQRRLLRSRVDGASERQHRDAARGRRVARMLGPRFSGGDGGRVRSPDALLRPAGVAATSGTRAGTTPARARTRQRPASASSSVSTRSALAHAIALSGARSNTLSEIRHGDIPMDKALSAPIVASQSILYALLARRGLYRMRHAARRRLRLSAPQSPAAST